MTDGEKITAGGSATLLGMDRAELKGLVEQAEEPSYRVQQVMESLYRQRVRSLDEITTIPGRFRESLAQDGFLVGLPVIQKKFVSQDGTVRYLMRASLTGKRSVETVWMPEGDGGEAGDGSEAGEVAERFAENSRRTFEAEAALERDGTITEPEPTPNKKRKRDQGQNPGRSTICISSQVGCAVDCQFCLTALLGV